MKAREILVSGDNGSLGCRVVDRLSEAGEHVRVMSRDRRADTVRADLLTGEGLKEAVEGVGTLVHCASSPPPQDASGGRGRNLAPHRAVPSTETGQTRI